MSVPYTILYDNPSEDIVTRLLKIRKIDSDPEHFLRPTYEEYRTDPFAYKDMDKAVERIIKAITDNEKIMIFGDYDVDGIMSSYILYTFITKFLGYKNISIRLPHRTKDGYGIKSKHIDEVKELGCKLIITVDNGITAINEAQHAIEQWIDMIITDHHQPLTTLPVVVALVNPHLCDFEGTKEICGAAVAFKLCLWLSEKLITDRAAKKQAHDRLLPFVAIATIADCMPLIDENRLLVKKWLEMMNTHRGKIAPSLRQMLDWLNIKQVEPFHVGFLIAPRLNATGRMASAHEGLNSLLFSDTDRQRSQLEMMDRLNQERRNMQETMVQDAVRLIDHQEMVLIAASDTFHEWIIGIVAGKLTERYNKPTLIMGVNTHEGTAVGSLRWPSYFSVIDMLTECGDLLERFGGHEQAWGLTVKLENLDKLVSRMKSYCSRTIDLDDLEKPLIVDTPLYNDELSVWTINKLFEFGPHGEGNPEPLFLLEDMIIRDAETVGKKGDASHLKLYCRTGQQDVTVMQRWKGSMIDQMPRNEPLQLIGRLKKDTYKGGFFVEGTGRF